MIEFHEQQIADNQRRIDELRGQFNHEVLTEKSKPAPMFGQALRLEDAKAFLTAYDDDKNKLSQGLLFISQEAAELESEKRRLRQLARVRITESWGVERPWSCGFMPYCINLIGDEVKICAQSLFSPLHFSSYNDAESFIKEVGQDGISKILSL